METKRQGFSHWDFNMKPQSRRNNEGNLPNHFTGSHSKESFFLEGELFWKTFILPLLAD